MLDLSNLKIRVGDIEEEKQCRSFIIHVECQSYYWQVSRRYSDFRDFRAALCSLILRHEDSCAERCHFLSGVHLDKFPRRILIHSRGALESRAIDLDAFLKKIIMRLNLCNKRLMAECINKDCPIAALLATFLDFPKDHPPRTLKERSHSHRLIRVSAGLSRYNSNNSVRCLSVVT